MQSDAQGPGGVVPVLVGGLTTHVAACVPACRRQAVATVECNDSDFDLPLAP